MKDAPDPAAPVPTTLLTGFLGAGKTTLLNRILTEAHGERIAVLVNEYGEVGVDGSLVVESAEELVELANGCVCCTVRGDLSRALEGLFAARDRRFLQKPFDRVVIEASGLASPGPIGQTLAVDPRVAGRVALDGVVVLTHAANLPAQLADRSEAGEQIAYADLVLLNHADRCDAEALAAAERAVRQRNAVAEVRPCVRGQIPVADLFGLGGGAAARWELAGDAAAHEHAPGISTVALASETPLDLHRLKLWLQFLANRRGQDLYRIKGVLRCAQRPEPVVVQGMYEWLEIGPGAGTAPDASRLVLIGRDLDRDELERGWAACRAGGAV